MKASDGRFEPGSPRLQDDSGVDEMAPVTHQIRGRNLAVGTVQLYVLGLWMMEDIQKASGSHMVFQIFAPWKLMETFQVGNFKRCFNCGCCMLFRNVRLQALTLHRRKHYIIAEVTCIWKHKFIVRDGSGNFE